MPTLRPKLSIQNNHGLGPKPAANILGSDRKLGGNGKHNTRRAVIMEGMPLVKWKG